MRKAAAWAHRPMLGACWARWPEACWALALWCAGPSLLHAQGSTPG